MAFTNKILLTTPYYPYPTLPANDALTDATGQRFTHSDDIFTAISHTHCYGNHILAQNIDVPSVLLEYPRWEHFTAEVEKGYEYIGISCFPVHLDHVLRMCEYIRENSPETQIMIGSYAAQAFKAKYDEETQKKYVDYAVKGEGVKFLRELLGEDINRPIAQKLMPKCGGSLYFIDKYPKGNIGFLVSGLGCPGACDFCSTTEMFGYKRLEMLSPEELVKHMHLYHKYFPDVSQIFVIEEDHFRHPEYLIKTKEYWESDPEVVEKLDWFAFGSVDYIWHFADKYGWDAIAELGIGCIFIGVESKFAGEHGYQKVKEADSREVFSELHDRGIRTAGAWICGWDFHDHSNIYEDLNYFVACYPTWEQLTRLSPFPGTALYSKLKKCGRVKNVAWDDVHFWSGAQENIALETHETLNLTEYGYELLYKTWGPSLLRRLDVTLRGYEHSLNSDNPVMRDHKSRFFAGQCALFWSMLGAMHRFAPNGVVRHRIDKIDEKYRDLIGEPTKAQKLMSTVLEKRATKMKKKSFLKPFNRHPKLEPSKRYLYLKTNKLKDGVIPYKTEVLTKKPFDMKWSKFKYSALGSAMKFVGRLKGKEEKSIVDEYLMKIIYNRRFSSGF